MLELWFNKSPLLIATNYFYYRPRSNNNGLYLTKCITDHQNKTTALFLMKYMRILENFRDALLKSCQMNLI